MTTSTDTTLIHGIRFVGASDVRRSALAAPLRDLLGPRTDGDPGALDVDDGVPVHVRFAAQGARAAGEPHDDDAFASIPFYSLCRGLFLPLSGLHPERTAAIFGLVTPDPLDAAAKEALLAEFLRKDVGLNTVQKIACALGDPFRGKKSTYKRDSMLSLLHTMQLTPRRHLIDRLTVVGDVSVLFAEHARTLRSDTPALTSAEVLEALRFLPSATRQTKQRVLRSLLQRMGSLEAYFFAKLLLRKAGFGFDYQGALLARVLAEGYGADVDAVNHAMALTDAFHVAEVLQRDGAEGLRAIQLQPLVPIRPALAHPGEEIEKYPVWVERKYDGVRFMLHKSTDSAGNALVGAYTRTRGDWLEMVTGLEATIKSFPCHNCIIDGELHGSVFGGDGPMPATVYDVYGQLTGQPPRPVALRYAAFDILYLNGRDLTSMPLKQRRQLMSTMLGPITQMPTPVPVSVVDGQMAHNKDDVSRMFHHFRNQGYEGIIAKDLDGPYRIATRDPSWRKRKPLITLDLVVLGGVLAVTTKERTGMFGSYVIGARRPDGSFEDVGDVAGLDVERDRTLQAEIVREGLVTGRRIERPSASGVRPGLELRPHIVVTLKFDGITRDNVTKRLSLRDPKIAMLRPDKAAHEADTVQDIEEISMRERFS
jgi:DNA ligase 1